MSGEDDPGTTDPNAPPDPAAERGAATERAGALDGFLRPECIAAGGERFTIRPISPRDAPAHAAFFHRLAPEDVRYRMFAALRELSSEQLDRLTTIDHETSMAYVAVRADGQTVAVARMQRTDQPGTVEFAAAVQPDAKRHGLATVMMRRLIGWARARGYRRVVGSVLADNRPMLAFARTLGFAARRSSEGPEIIEVRLDLQAGADQPAP